MPRFAEAPHFLIEKYFDSIVETALDTPTRTQDIVGDLFVDVGNELENWTESNTVGTIQEEEINMYAVYDMKVDTAAVGNTASMTKDVSGSFTDGTSIEIFLNNKSLGTSVSGDAFVMSLQINSTFNFSAAFNENGIDVLKNGTYTQAVSSGSLVEDEWQRWRFLVDTSGTEELCDVYLNGTQVANSVSCSGNYSGSTGRFELRQNGYTETTRTLVSEILIEDEMIEPKFGQTTWSDGGRLKGLKTTSVADGGYWTKVWVESEGVKKYLICSDCNYQDYVSDTGDDISVCPVCGTTNFTITEINKLGGKFIRETDLRIKAEGVDSDNEDVFVFSPGGPFFSTGDVLSSSVGTIITPPSGTSTYSYEMTLYDTVSPTTTFDSGDGVYFRKDSYFHDWLNGSSTRTIDGVTYTIDNFVNTNKEFLYFGNVYKVGDGDTANIIFNGMKNFAKNGLPEHQQTTKMNEFLKLYYDRVHQHPYHKLKDVWTMFAPYETDINYLQYLANMYGKDYPDGISNAKKREFVKNIIYFLKRVGTYTSLYIIWRIMNPDTLNRLNVYERWHEYTRTGIPKGYFEDELYLSAYGVEPTTCAGTEFYQLYKPSNYPTNATFSNSPSGKMLSPHYRVEIDVSCEPIDPDDEKVLTETTIEALMESWEDIRPVSKFSHYSILVAPIADFTGLYQPTYSEELYHDYIQSKFCQSLTGTVTNYEVLIHEQNAASMAWTIDHYTGTEDYIVHCYDFDLNRIIPENTYPTSINSYTVEFNEPVVGYAYLIAPAYTYNKAVAGTTWSTNTGLGQKQVLVQIRDASKYDNMPENTRLGNPDVVEVTYPVAKDGYIFAEDSDYNHTEITPASTWTIPHDLGQPTTAVFYDGNWNMIHPESVTQTSYSIMTASFTESTSGYALVKGITGQNQGTFISGSLLPATWKVGTGTDLDSFDPVTANDIKTVALSGGPVTYRDYTSYYTLDFTIDNTDKIDITEIGIFDNTGDIAFYTKVKNLIKDEDTSFRVFYKISKSPL